jgi:hypothetical protein
MAAYKVKAAVVEDLEDVEVEMDEDDDKVSVSTMSVQQVVLLASLKTTCCQWRIYMQLTGCK